MFVFFVFSGGAYSAMSTRATELLTLSAEKKTALRVVFHLRVSVAP